VLINPRTNTAKRRVHETLIRAMSPLETVLAKDVQRVLLAQYQAVAGEIASGSRDLDGPLARYDGRLQKTLEVHYRRTAIVFGNLVFQAMGDGQKTAAPPPSLAGDESMRERYWSEVHAWIQKEGAEAVRRIHRTTRDKIKTLVDEGLSEGASNREIAKDLRDTSRAVTAYRSKVIAKTETHNAACFATDRAVAATGVEVEREWSAVRDARTRITHILANGQRRRQNRPFDVGGDKLDHPGDRKGRAANVVHCRCVLLYHTVDADTAAQPALPPLSDVTTLDEAEKWAKDRWPNVAFDFPGAHLDTIKPTLAQFERLARDYPEVPARLGYMGTRTVSDIAQNVYAQVTQDGKRIEMNPWFYGDPRFFKNSLKQSVSSGFHPLGCHKYESVLTHEFDHLVRTWLLTETGLAFMPAVPASGVGLYSETMSLWENSHNATEFLSMYATENKSEGWAEGSAAIHHHPYPQRIVFVKEQKALLDIIKNRPRYNQGQWKHWQDANDLERQESLIVIDQLKRKAGIRGI
jgi:hypothetical protein